MIAFPSLCRRWLATLTACLLCAACGAELPVAPAPLEASPAVVRQSDKTHILWALEGDTNTTYLMGSVHALRNKDYPLSQTLAAAYENAHALVMELPLNDLDPAAMAATMQARGFFAEGETLSSWLGPDDYARASKKSAALGINLDQFDDLEPWLAALTVLNLQMQKAGYSPDSGVEAHFADRAKRDGKAVVGLESLDEQLEIFDSLSRSEQIQLLFNTLDDVSDLNEGLDTLVDAWQRGDTAALEKELKEGFDGLPGMYDALVVRRNHRWLKSIEALTTSDHNHLVIVGAMHLVGSDSVIALLEQRGFRLRKL